MTLDNMAANNATEVVGEDHSIRDYEAEANTEREAEIASEAARRAEADVRKHIEDAEAKKARAYSRAYGVVADSLIDGGHHPRHIPDQAALYQRAIADMLLEISTMPVDFERLRQFGAASNPAAVAKGAAVGSALGGGQ